MTPEEVELLGRNLVKVGVPVHYLENIVVALEAIEAGEGPPPGWHEEPLEPELRPDPTGVDCLERYEAPEP